VPDELANLLRRLILRCTARALELLGTRSASLSSMPPHDDDWYLNLVWIDRRKCLLLVHAGTLFPIFAADVRKGDLRPVGSYVVSLIEEHLQAEGIPADALGQLDAEEVLVDRTASRSILAFMRDMAIHAKYRIEAMGGLERTDVAFLNRYLRRSPHNRGEYVRPLDLARERAGLPRSSEWTTDPLGRRRPSSC
jgi:hypothetical protein